ncbi:MAG: dethiobiotin synthase [Flavobacteriaceae bacterium]|nr:dethiobiotin synthase [Flavobacteriaceae bacterium]
MQRIFITGIGTEVGKTVVAAIITQALKADYWKPIQAGDLHYSDTDKVRDWVLHESTVFHPNAFALNTPMSPHAAAAIDGVEVKLQNIRQPKSENAFMVVEGAGGLLVPINDTETMADMLTQEDKVVVVSRHYLGSINHSLLSLTYLKEKGLDVGIVFNGVAHPTTEQAIQDRFDYSVIGRLDEEPFVNERVVAAYADMWQEELLKWLQNK